MLLPPNTLARWLAVASIALAAACANYTPDLYLGGDLWRGGDGTTYSSPAPIEVEDVEITSSRMGVAGPGKDVRLELEMTAVVSLADGTRHEVRMDCGGRPGERTGARESFVAKNGRRYDVSIGAVLYELSATATVTVRAPGPVSFQKTVTAH